MSQRPAATLVWMREEDDRPRGAAAIRREYCRDLKAFVSQRKSNLASGSKDWDRVAPTTKEVWVSSGA